MNWKFWKKEPPQISEPVISLIYEMSQSVNWHVKRDSGLCPIYTLTHQSKEVKLDFYIDPHGRFKCMSQWMTSDERFKVGIKFDILQQNLKNINNVKERQRIAKELGV